MVASRLKPARIEHVVDGIRLRAQLSAAYAAEGENARASVRKLLHGALFRGRMVAKERLEAGENGMAVARLLAEVADEVVAALYDYTTTHIFRARNPTEGERFAIVAVGGYGRGELAPSSDLDLLFLRAYKQTAFDESVTEYMLYMLWDMGLKVGHSSRNIDECLKLAREDHTIQTALLEARRIAGDESLAQELFTRFRKEVADRDHAAFITAKLTERDERHARAGASRYMVEPNIKEGKGGLRDLHTLFWLARRRYGLSRPRDYVDAGVFTNEERNAFRRALEFLWTVRCHLHFITGRAEERLTFDLQPELAKRMGYGARANHSAVERFMKRYFLVAKEVGALTRTLCARLEADNAKQTPKGLQRFLPTGKKRVAQVEVGFCVEGGRLNTDNESVLETPVNVLRLFALAEKLDLDIHPDAFGQASRHVRAFDPAWRKQPEARAAFLDVATSKRHPGAALRLMNEAGVLGKFVPEFGRIVAQMQHNLYHIYTVDEHTIRAIGILSQIESGELADELPLSTEVMPKLLSRRELYVALFLHDIAKGRAGDHSELGEVVAKRLCPRFGLADDATETVAWLVRHHLVMSRFAFKRDTEDPQTVQDFVSIVQSPERLKLLLLLTATDIRAVGPNVWNGWKGQLLRELYLETAAAMATGDAQGRRAGRIERAKERLAEALADLPDRPWSPEAIESYLARHDPRYWLGSPREEHLRHALIVGQADAARAPFAIDFRIDEFRARTEMLLYGADHPGLFMKVAGALALSGVSIVDAHIFTTTDGMALDTLGFQDAGSRLAVTDQARLARIRENTEKALRGEIWFEKALAGRRTLPPRADVFQVEPRVLIDNSASRTHSVIEVNGRDRPGLLFDLAKALKDLGLVIHSAHISTYGERVVDVFYVKDVFGLKIAHRGKMQKVQRRLAEALTPQ